ncbi:MAG: dihydrofolate reductase [Patescibacteria group bacterium]|nr:dihydrofolate reductase [Patescibacteria group bacterium]
MINFSAVAVVTIDGKIAKNKNHHTNWSSRADKIFLKTQIEKSDVIVVGHNTYNVAKKNLPNHIFLKRKYIVLTSRPKKNVFGHNVLWCDPEKVDLLALVKKYNYKKICVLGGTKTYTTLMKQNLINELFLTIEPIIFGSGLNLFDGENFSAKFRLRSIKKLNSLGTILLHYLKLN